MPKTPNSKGKSPTAIKATARTVSTSARSLRKRAEAFQAAAKHARRKRTEASEQDVVVAVSNLVDERLDAETVLRHAERAGLQVRALQEAIEYASNLIASHESDASQNDPPNPNPKSKKVATPSPEKKRDSESDDDGEDEGEERVRRSRASKDKGARSKLNLSAETRVASPSRGKEAESRVNTEPIASTSRTSKSILKKNSKSPSLDIVPEDDEEEEIQEVSPLIKGKTQSTSGKQKSRDSKKSKRHDSPCSRTSEQQRDLNEAELSLLAAENRIKLLMTQLEAEKQAVETYRQNIKIHRDRVSNKSGSSSRSSSVESEDSDKGRPKSGKSGKSGKSENRDKPKTRQDKVNPPEPTRSRVDEWVENSQRESKKLQEDRRSAIDEISQATASVLRQHMLQAQAQNQNPSNPSVLEGIKILERRRPSEKFTGEDSTIDFEDHITQFEEAMDVPGLPDSFKLAELKAWFGGVAKVHISRYVRRKDHEVALKEAIEKLREEHGKKTATAEEMIDDILSGKVIEARDAVGINSAVSKLEEAYFLAVETGRDADFNRRSLFKNILNNLFPYLKIKWASEVTKALEKGEACDKFEHFLRFLTRQKRIASEMHKLSMDAENDSKSGKSDKKPVRKDRKVEDGFTKVGKRPKKPRSGERPRPGQKDCSLCDNEKHPLHACKKFAELETEDRWEYCFERMLCPKCLRGGHKVEDCTFVARCRSCSGGHNTLLHGAKNMPENLKQPVEAERQA